MCDVETKLVAKMSERLGESVETNGWNLLQDKRREQDLRRRGPSRNEHGETRHRSTIKNCPVGAGGARKTRGSSTGSQR